MITQEELRSILEYSPLTGEFTWLQRKVKNQVKVGDKAGTTQKDGYVQIGIDNKKYHAHRLAWLYTFGVSPREQIDHVDGNPSNNKLGNLREVSPTENQRNQKMKSNNTSGITGVTLQRKRQGTKTYEYWITYWYDPDGERQYKVFSVLKHGFEQAKKLSTEYRERQIREINALGSEYTARHGSAATQ